MVVVVQMDLKWEEIVLEMVEKKTCLYVVVVVVVVVVVQEILDVYLWMFEKLEE
jgi:hypothetical protein